MSYQQWIASIGARFFFPLQLSIPSDHFNPCQRIGRHWARCSQACVLNNEYYAFFPSKINLKLTWFQINPSVVFGRELLLLQTFPDCRFVLYWHGSRFLFQAIGQSQILRSVYGVLHVLHLKFIIIPSNHFLYSHLSYDIAIKIMRNRMKLCLCLTQFKEKLKIMLFFLMKLSWHWQLYKWSMPVISWRHLKSVKIIEN